MKTTTNQSRLGARLHTYLQPATLCAPWHPYYALACAVLAALLVLKWWGWHVGSGLLLLMLLGMLCAHLQRYRRYLRQQQLNTQSPLDPQWWAHVDAVIPLTATQQRLVERGLLDFFCVYAGQPQALLMPSQAVDALWHAMLRDPVQYEAWCRRWLGRVLTHHPAAVLAGWSASQRERAWCHTWRACCLLEQQDPKTAQQLPRLFVIDSLLAWPSCEALASVADCTLRYRTWLAQHSSSDSSSDSDSSDSGCGGGCGGD